LTIKAEIEGIDTGNQKTEGRKRQSSSTKVGRESVRRLKTEQKSTKNTQLYT
jgi:hypothetical protein